MRVIREKENEIQAKGRLQQNCEHIASASGEEDEVKVVERRDQNRERIATVREEADEIQVVAT